MFPDTANFTDPNYLNTGDTIDLTGTNDPRIFLPQTGDILNDPTTYDPGNSLLPSTPFLPSTPSTGGAASNSQVQASSPSASILGWLGLANNVANTAANAARTGGTTRPGVNQKPASSLGSFGSVTTTTLLVIVALFVGVVFMLRKT